jgi:hypothetical protein
MPYLWSEADRRRVLAEHQRAAERLPSASLGEKMFSSAGAQLLPDAERQAVSPLGGLARPAAKPKAKP